MLNLIIFFYYGKLFSEIQDFNTKLTIIDTEILRIEKHISHIRAKIQADKDFKSTLNVNKLAGNKRGEIRKNRNRRDRFRKILTSLGKKHANLCEKRVIITKHLNEEKRSEL